MNKNQEKPVSSEKELVSIKPNFPKEDEVIAEDGDIGTFADELRRNKKKFIPTLSGHKKESLNNIPKLIKEYFKKPVSSEKELVSIKPNLLIQDEVMPLKQKTQNISSSFKDKNLNIISGYKKQSFQRGKLIKSTLSQKSKQYNSASFKTKSSKYVSTVDTYGTNSEMKFSNLHASRLNKTLDKKQKIEAQIENKNSVFSNPNSFRSRVVGKIKGTGFDKISYFLMLIDKENHINLEKVKKKYSKQDEGISSALIEKIKSYCEEYKKKMDAFNLKYNNTGNEDPYQDHELFLRFFTHSIKKARYRNKEGGYESLPEFNEFRYHYSSPTGTFYFNNKNIFLLKLPDLIRNKNIDDLVPEFISDCHELSDDSIESTYQEGNFNLVSRYRKENRVQKTKIDYDLKNDNRKQKYEESKSIEEFGIPDESLEENEEGRHNKVLISDKCNAKSDFQKKQDEKQNNIEKIKLMLSDLRDIFNDTSIIEGLSSLDLFDNQEVKIDNEERKVIPKERTFDPKKTEAVKNSVFLSNVSSNKIPQKPPYKHIRMKTGDKKQTIMENKIKNKIENKISEILRCTESDIIFVRELKCRKKLYNNKLQKDHIGKTNPLNNIIFLKNMSKLNTDNKNIRIKPKICLPRESIKVKKINNADKSNVNIPTEEFDKFFEHNVSF